MSSLTRLFNREDNSSLIGLDISTSSAKLVELSQSKSGEYTLEHCGIELFEQGWIEGGNIENFDSVVAAVQRLVRTSGTKAKRVALAMPPSAVITKKILLSADLSEMEMEAQVEAEASQYIPFPLEEVRLDFHVIGEAPNSGGADVEVLLAASRREKVDDRQAIGEEAGLKPAVIDVDSFAARLAASRVMDAMRLGHNSIAALFEIGSATTTIQVLRNGEAIYERDLSFGGQQLTQAMARQYGFTLQEAESKKRNNEVPDDYATTLIPEFVENAAAEISRALQLFLSSTVYGRVDHILLAGGAANVQGLDSQVAKQSGCPATILDPFEGMKIGRGVRQQRLHLEAPSYLTACGLAMRRFYK